MKLLVPALLLTACGPRSAVVPDGAPPDAEPTAAIEWTDPTVATSACGSLGEAEGDYVPQGSRVDLAGAACVAAVHATAGAAGSVLELTFDADEDLVVSATDPGGRVLLPSTLVAAGDAVEVEPRVSGEVLVRLAPAAPSAEDWRYGLEVACVDGCDRQYTRYPVLLLHGMGGADSFGGVDYFLGVPGELADAGVVVAAPAVSPFGTSLERAQEWEVALDELLAQGHRRVNLLGHSQGGLDARVLASDAGLARGDVVASVTTIGTPHRGTQVADLVSEGIVGGVVQPWALDLGASVFVELFGLDASDPRLAAAIGQLSTPVSEALDAATPDHAGTEYWSWAGRSCGILEPVCQDQHDGEIVGALLGATYLLLWPTPNDGMVPVPSQQHGTFLGEVPADHANEIGQFDDQVPDPFDHLRFYRSEVVRLRDAGL